MLRDKQASFRNGRDIVEQIFILRNIIEQVVEWQASLYITFVDFEKALTKCTERVYGELWNSTQDNPHGSDVIQK